MAAEAVEVIRPRGWLGRWREENQGRIEEWRRGVYRFRHERIIRLTLRLVKSTGSNQG